MANTTYYNLVIYEASSLIGDLVNNNATIIDTALHAHDLAIAAITTMTGATSSEAGTGGLVPGPAAGDQDKFLRGDGTWQSAPSYSEATSSTYGLVKTGYTTSGKNYAVQLSSGKMYVNVPWENTTYSQATSSALGLVKIGYSASGKNYAVQLDGSGKMYVYVPWTDNNTTYSEATSSNYGLVKIGYSGSGKYYPVQLSSGKMYVYVPWSDTTYSVATTSANGLMSAADKSKLNGIQAGAKTDSDVYFNNGYLSRFDVKFKDLGTQSGIGTEQSINFDSAFNTACFGVVIVVNSNPGSYVQHSVYDWSKTGFKMKIYTGGGANVKVSYIAFGY